MSRPRVLDLFCGAGGAAGPPDRSSGYGKYFDVVGVDIEPQPHYPFEFYQADVMEEILPEIPGGLWGPFDAIHASPPCQAYSTLNMGQHPDLYEDIRRLLEDTGLPWVIENVPGAPFRSGVTLCGSMFDLPVRRHRNFESSVMMMVPPHHCPTGVLTVTGHCGSTPHSRKPDTIAEARAALGIDWDMTLAETAQAIPPAYTEFIGAQLLAHVQAVTA